mgnify:CR=1 FL=1
MHSNSATSPAATPWWQRTTVYQIYPRSFCDSNGDGIGDLPGIISKLDYLRELGVQTLWLSPFVKSPQRDFGYDISDHYAIAPEYGTMEDCHRFVEEAHARGLRVVLDMVLNHTSDEHPYFQESRQSRDNPRRDFYIWRPGRKPGGAAPPNNWRSLIGPRGWQYDAKTDEWYYASFLPFQPDLNYRNPAVQQAMLDVVRHWLRLGFDGMRLDIFNCLFKDPDFTPNPFSSRPLPSEDCPDGFFQSYRNTVNHPDTLAFARTLRRVVDEFSDPPRFLVGEVFGAPSLLRKYCAPEGGGDGDGLHLVFLFKSLRTPFSAPAFYALIDEFEREFPRPLVPTYVFGNHDRPRAIERLEHHYERAKLLAALQLTVRGVPFIYYGEEIAMRNLDLRMRDALDPLAHNFRHMPDAVAHFLRRRGIALNRDECRGPMQWTGAANAGFTTETARPWLPISPQHQHANVLVERQHHGSLFHCYKRLLALRAEHPALHSGTLTLHSQRDAQANALLGYTRNLDGKSCEVRHNFAARPQTVFMSRSAQLLFSTHLDGGRLQAGSYTMRPYESIVTTAP